jgi:hypothetical protein
MQDDNVVSQSLTDTFHLGRLRVSARMLTAAVLALLPLVYFFPAVMGQVSLVPGDGWAQNLGVRALIGQMLARGWLPLWNPYIFAGTPLLASIYPGALYPPNWLFALLSPGAAINVVVITTYHLALIGSYLFGRRTGMDRVSALVTGMIFTFGGYMLVHLGHTSRIAAAAWLPWVLLAVEHLYRRASWRWVALGALFVALQFCAGEPQMTLYTALVAGAYSLFSLTAREECERRWRFLAAGVVMAWCGVLLSMIQLLPGLELLGQGERARLSYEYFSSYSFPPRQVLNLIFPYFFGGVAVAPYRVAYWGEWNAAMLCGYVGVLSLLLALVAVLGPRGERRTPWKSSDGDSFFLGPVSFRLSLQVSFWSGVAVASLLLACGAYLPFGVYRWLHHVPGYNLFRGPYRHLFEFNFAAAVLAGLGASFMAQMGREAVRRAHRRSTAVVAALVAVTAIIYRFFGERLVTRTPRPAPSGSLADAEALIPLLVFLLCATGLWLYAQRRNNWTGALLIAVLLVDLASFGQFFAWRGVFFTVNARLADPPSVVYLKAREPDPHAFRLLSYASLPYDYAYLPPHDDNYELLNFPNPSIARGLQSVNGYDAMRLSRAAAIAGEMDLDGILLDIKALDTEHQGFNLLNVKYLLRERRGALEAGEGITYEGVRFSQTPLHLVLGPKARAEPRLRESVMATELAVISLMSNSTHIPQGAPVVRIRLRAKDGRLVERELEAGRDTAEWAYDRAEVRAAAKHQRARVIESFDGGGFEGHFYLARLPFERAEIERIELDYLRADGGLQIVRASLFDAATGAATPLDDVPLPPERWQSLARFGEIELYENLKARPRAWFVRRVETKPRAEVLRTIKEGRLADGSPFDPSELALLEMEDFSNGAITLPPVEDATGARVTVTRYEPQRIELKTNNPEAAFLVLSEVYYRGWEARIDGRPTTIYRTDYALRGIAVPPGEHGIEFLYRAPSFRRGAMLSGLGVALLLIGAVIGYGLRHRRLTLRV